MAKVATNQERLNQIFDIDSRNDTSIGNALGVSKQTISAWRKGTRSPKRSMVIKIAEMYNTTPEWLLGWDLESPSGEVSASPLSDLEQKLIAAFRSADERARADAMNTLLAHPKE